MEKEEILNEEETAEEAQTEATAEEEKDELTKLKESYAELYDKYLRLAAEYDNYKKRTAKEKDEIYSNSKADVVVKLLPVIDNMDRAQQFAGDDSVSEGVKLIKKQFDDYLEKLGITEIEAEGKEFDPNFHNAVLHEDVEGEAENMIVQVLQKGYLLGDKVIRHAMVKVIN